MCDTLHAVVCDTPHTMWVTMQVLHMLGVWYVCGYKILTPIVMPTASACLSWLRAKAKLCAYWSWPVASRADSGSFSFDFGICVSLLCPVTPLWHCWQTRIVPNSQQSLLSLSPEIQDSRNLVSTIELGYPQLPTLDSHYSLSLIYCTSRLCLPVLPIHVTSPCCVPPHNSIIPDLAL